MRTLCLLLALAACRADPGDPAYPDVSTFGLGGGSDDATGFLAGPDPYQADERRLSLTIFYEGPASDELLIDDLTRHFFIFENTFAVTPVTERTEGLLADQITRTNPPWFGGGVNYDVPEDLSSWDTMHVSLNSSDEAMANLALIMNDGAEARLFASSYGFETDGAWHHLTIPLADFEAVGLDLSTVTAPFVFVGEAGTPGEAILIDNLYFTGE